MIKMKRKIETEALVVKTIEFRNERKKRRRRATIFFADLVNSTGLKIQKKPIEAEEKIWNHNNKVAEIIKSFNGTVVKYIGDGVMATFEDNKPELMAITAAIKIFKDFKKENNKEHLPDIDKIESKIGISSGMVSFWGIDPIGIAVDIAWRIGNQAKPTQILCSKEIKDKCLKYSKKIKFGNTVKRELKGVKKGINICEVIWDKELGIEEIPHFSVIDESTKRHMEKAWDAEAGGDYDGANREYGCVLDKDDRNFIANLRIGEILYYSTGSYKKAKKYIKKARTSNPFSARARNRLIGILGVTEDEKKKSLPNTMLDQIISQSIVALKYAREQADDLEEIGALNNMAYAYVKRYQKDKNKEDWESARKLCNQLLTKYHWIENKKYSDYLDTIGFILMQKENLDDNDIFCINKLFDKAERLDGNNIAVSKHQTHLKGIVRNKGQSLDDIIYKLSSKTFEEALELIHEQLKKQFY